MRSEGHRVAVRAQILAGARRAFAHGGYLGTNVPEIAAASAVSVGLIYRYFDSKQELFVELCVNASEQAYKELEAELAEIEDPGLLLRHAISAFLDAHTDGNDRIVLSGWSSADRDPTIGASMRKRSADLVAFSERVAAMLTERGSAEPMERKRLGLSTKLLLDGILVHFAVHGDDTDRQELLDAAVALVSAGAGIGGPRARAAD